MFELYDKVAVSNSGTTGIIIDIDTSGNEPLYTVESDTETEDDYGTLFPQYHCRENEIQKVMTA